MWHRETDSKGLKGKLFSEGPNLVAPLIVNRVKQLEAG